MAVSQPTARQLNYWNERLRTYRLGEHRGRNTNKLSYYANVSEIIATSATQLDDDDDDFDPNFEEDID